MDRNQISQICEEWHKIWKDAAIRRGEDVKYFLSLDWLKMEFHTSPRCRECGIPCGSHGWNDKGEIQCCYCAVQHKGPHLCPLPTHGVPFYLYVKKHRDWCRRGNRCTGIPDFAFDCEAREICSRLDREQGDLLTFII